MFYSTENTSQIERKGCGYVYFVRAEGLYPKNDMSWGRYKIGRTQNLEQRIRSLNNNQQATFNRLLFAIAVKDYSALEKSLHQKYHQYKFTGNKTSKEWFDLPREWETSIETLYCRLEQKYYYFQEDAPQTQVRDSKGYSRSSSSGDSCLGCLMLFVLAAAAIVWFTQSTPEGQQYFDRLQNFLENTSDGI
ncbi:MAG: GIY-YIG nuclease family protein [Cyanobacteriota bacterium]|nr:GIY-YIG nuclease family protein [Cyanobacteriota bacterium]